MDTSTSSLAEPAPLLKMVDTGSALQEKECSSSAANKNAPVNALTSPPRAARASAMETLGGDSQQGNGYDRPPMSVVVVSTPSTSDSGHSVPSTTASSSSFSSPFSAPFRLQPRGVMSLAVTKPGGRGEASRGRKRSAQSMSTSMARDSLLTTKTAPTPPPIPSHERKQAQAPIKRDRDGIGDIFTDNVSAAGVGGGPQPVYGGTPPRGKRSIGNALINFQCLSLQSPKRNDTPGSSSCPGTPPQALLIDAPNTAVLFPSSSSSHACTPKRPAMVASSVGSFHSQATPTSNTMPPPRSSFTPVYSAASPGGCSMRSYGSGSIGSNSRMNAGARSVFSPGGGSAKSSPKIASLTVLQDKGTKVLSSRESNARLPPRGMNSLWLSLESSSDSDSDAYSLSPRKDSSFRMLPPQTVHCRKPSLDSISMVQDIITSPPGFPSPSSSIAPSAPRLRTPRDRQTRPPLVNQLFVSPKEQTPRTPQTPLPRVTLTPRSTGSRRSNHSGMHLPRFPSPSDADMDVTSPFLSTSAAASLRDMPSTGGSGGSSFAAIQCLFPESSTSLALSADGSANEDKVVLPSKEATEEKKAPFPVLHFATKMEEAGDAAPFSGGDYMGIQTKSLLTASRSGGMLQAMMEEDERKAGAGDFGSVSDIDDDEGFILAAPCTIEEERFASCQPARQRRRRSTDRFSSASPNLSNTNLAGMNYVASNTSLFGMDIAHPTEPTGILGASTTLASTASQIVTGPADMLQNQHRRKSDTSLASIGLALEGSLSGRDLVTPPPMASPQMPPLLSPREGYVLPVMCRERNMEEHRPNQTNVCIAGADRRSVTMAIAKMAFESKHHSGLSPVL